MEDMIIRRRASTKAKSFIQIIQEIRKGRNEHGFAGNRIPGDLAFARDHRGTWSPEGGCCLGRGDRVYRGVDSLVLHFLQHETVVETK